MRIKQINVDCWGCRGDINNAGAIISMAAEVAVACGSKVIGSAVQDYYGQGLTAVIFLAESHILISTYPDTGYAVVEIFLCDDHTAPEVCWEKIKEYLQPEKEKIFEFYHEEKSVANHSAYAKAIR